MVSELKEYIERIRLEILFKKSVIDAIPEWKWNWYFEKINYRPQFKKV